MMIDPLLTVTILFLMLLYFVWSNYTHIKLLRNLEKKLLEAKSNLFDTRNLLNTRYNQINVELISIRDLENSLIRKELDFLKNENAKTSKLDGSRIFGNISRPTNNELENMDLESRYYNPIEKLQLPEPPKNDLHTP